jgi:hypothetical protein
VTYCVDRNGATSLDVSLLGGLRAVEEEGARQEVEMAAYEVIRYLEVRPNKRRHTHVQFMDGVAVSL